MDSSETRKKFISLGKQLVAQLNAHDHADTFSRWVAYYVAEQIVEAEKSTGEEKARAERQCFEAILALWSHRNNLPDGLRPFQGFEPVLRALASLDPEEPRSMYYHLPTQPKMTEEASEISELIEFVISLDRVARILIQFVLAEATAKAVRPEMKLMLDNAMATSMTKDLHSIQELIRRSGALQCELADVEMLRPKKAWLEELDKFCSLAEGFRDSLRKELEMSRENSVQPPTE